MEPKLTLKMLERMRIESALAECKGNISKAAVELGISRRTLQRKMKQYENVKEESQSPGDDALHQK